MGRHLLEAVQQLWASVVGTQHKLVSDFNDESCVSRENSLDFSERITKSCVACDAKNNETTRFQWDCIAYWLTEQWDCKLVKCLLAALTSNTSAKLSTIWLARHRWWFAVWFVTITACFATFRMRTGSDVLLCVYGSRSTHAFKINAPNKINWHTHRFPRNALDTPPHLSLAMWVALIQWSFAIWTIALEECNRCHNRISASVRYNRVTWPWLGLYLDARTTPKRHSLDANCFMSHRVYVSSFAL